MNHIHYANMLSVALLTNHDSQRWPCIMYADVIWSVRSLIGFYAEWEKQHGETIDNIEIRVRIQKAPWLSPRHRAFHLLTQYPPIMHCAGYKTQPRGLVKRLSTLKLGLSESQKWDLAEYWVLAIVQSRGRMNAIGDPLLYSNTNAPQDFISELSLKSSCTVHSMIT